jgi:hypothetical protein
MASLVKSSLSPSLLSDAGPNVQCCLESSEHDPSRRDSFFLSCAPKRHGDGFEPLEREKHLDANAKVLGNFHGQLQAWLVIATLEIANGLVIDPDGFGQFAPGRASFRAKQ